MNKYLLRTLIGTGLILAATSFSPADRFGETARLELADMIDVTTHQRVLELSIARAEALGQLLSHIVDEKTARESLPAVERCYLEMEMLGIRMTMLPAPSVQERTE